MYNLFKYIFFCLLLDAYSGHAQIAQDSTALKIFPPQSMGDIFHSKKLLLGKGIFSGTISYNFNRSVFMDSADNKYRLQHSPGYSLKIKLYEEVSLSSTFFVQLNKKAVRPWTADYFYSLKRFNWRPNTFSYGYENYMNNKYADDGEAVLQKFLQGYFFVSYNHGLPKKWIETIRLDNTTRFTLTYLTRFAFKYTDENLVLHDQGRLWLGVAARYTIWKNIYTEGAMNFYPDKSKRLPWDPDFTYGFGYFDWRPFKFSITYGNWVVNRFNNKPAQYNYYGFLDGNIQISFNYVW